MSKTDTPNKEEEKYKRSNKRINPSTATEVSEMGTKPSRPNKSAADPRFQPFVAAIKQYWDFKNPKMKFDFTPADGRQLNLLLRDKNFTLEQFRTCMRNRAQSDLVHAEAPHRWLLRIKEFFTCPLDKFWKPKWSEVDEHGGHYEGDVYVTKDGERMPGYTPA